MKIRIAHSPDPDDAFMFYGLSGGGVDPGPYQFEHVLNDIQTLNEHALRGDYEVTAISIHAYPSVAEKYALTSCGSSMGDDYGPIVVTRGPMPIEEPTGGPVSDRSSHDPQTGGPVSDRSLHAPPFGGPVSDRSLQSLHGKHIAIPGEMTTAFLALQLCLGRGTFDHRVVMFDRILDEVAEGRADAGLVIHEGQLTYASQGLHVAVDLGKWWRRRTGLPLPLGGNAIRRDLGPRHCRRITRLIRDSIQYGLDHRAEAVRHALQYGRGLDTAKADQFVGMYVNEWTLDYGPRGREAVQRLLSEGATAGIVRNIGEIDFVTP